MFMSFSLTRSTFHISVVVLFQIWALNKIVSTSTNWWTYSIRYMEIQRIPVSLLRIISRFSGLHCLAPFSPLPLPRFLACVLVSSLSPSPFSLQLMNAKPKPRRTIHRGCGCLRDGLAFSCYVAPAGKLRTAVTPLHPKLPMSLNQC